MSQVTNFCKKNIFKNFNFAGNRNVFWIFNSTMKLNNWNSATIYIPKNSNNLPYRFSILAKSANAATSIAVSVFDEKFVIIFKLIF